MSDFAFRDSSRPAALSAPAELRKSRTGLWSGEIAHPAAHTITLGHFSKASAKAALEERSMKAFGRVPKYVHEDD